MGLQKFRKNILKATHNLEFLAVWVFPDSSITLDTRMSNLDIRVSKLDIRMSRLDIRVSVPTILVLTNHLNKNYSWLAVVFIQMVCPNLYLEKVICEQLQINSPNTFCVSETQTC